jgi:hypothetical protein
VKAQRQCREDRAAPDYGLPKAAREALLTTFVSILCLPVVGVIDISVLNIALAFIRLMKWTFQDYQQGALWWPVGNLDNSVSMLKLRLKNCLQGHGETSWSVHVRPNYALAGPLRGQSFWVKLKAHTKGWVAQWVHAERPR